MIKVYLFIPKIKNKSKYIIFNILYILALDFKAY